MPDSALRTPNPALLDACQKAIAAIEQAMQLPGGKVGDRLGEAERAVVRLRDDLIDQLRRADSPTSAAAYREALDHVNVTLSVLIGLEYPVGSLQRQKLQQARDLLNELVSRGLPDPIA